MPFGFLKRLWYGPNADLRPFDDSTLGRMELERDGSVPTWKVRLPCGISISVQGRDVPDSATLDRAKAIAGRVDEFSRTILEFMKQERAKADFEHLKAVTAHLNVDEIALWSARASGCDGMVFFKGRTEDDDIYAWRCDLVAGLPANFGYDD